MAIETINLKEETCPLKCKRINLLIGIIRWYFLENVPSNASDIIFYNKSCMLIDKRVYIFYRTADGFISCRFKNNPIHPVSSESFLTNLF